MSEQVEGGLDTLRNMERQSAGFWMLSGKFSSGGWRRSGLCRNGSLRGLRSKGGSACGGRGWCRLRFRQRWFSAWLCCGRWLRRGGMLCSRIFGSGPWPKRKMQRAVPGGQRWFASLIGKPQLHRQNQQGYQQRQQKKKQPAYEFEHRQQDGEHNGHRQSLPFQLFAVLGGIDGRIRFSFRGFVVPCFAVQRRQVSQRAQAEHT